MIDNIDFKQLNTLTAFIKAESESTADFTIPFLECLMTRYNLQSCIATEISYDEIPDDIIHILKDGKIPTKEDLLPLDTNMQNNLIAEMVWFAGANRIAYYTVNEEVEEGMPNTLDCILAMRDVSSAHFYASYLFAALTLLMNRVPTYDFVSALTNNFEDTTENVDFIATIFCEVCSSLYVRHSEDLEFFFELQEKDENEEDI